MYKRQVYVPFWMYDLESSGRFQYQGTRVRFWETEKYECTETSFYHIVRKGSMKFCRIPVDGSEKIDDTMMEAIEPYDYQELEPFQLSYIVISHFQKSKDNSCLLYTSRCV